VQVGITSIGILNGAIGEASIAGRLGAALERPARFIDRFLRPRLSMFVEGVFVRVIATVSC